MRWILLHVVLNFKYLLALLNEFLENFLHNSNVIVQILYKI